MALLPVAHTDYNTIVFEFNQQLFVKETPWQLIQSSCLENCSTYEGRRAAVMYHMGIKRKVPIPINPSKNLFTFPTHSPTEFECSWIFFNHILEIIQHPSIEKNSLQSIITFKNNQQLPVNVSHYILEKQFQRTGVCRWKFGGCDGSRKS